MSKKRAFTMVELIFVIVILGILAAVAVPRLNKSRQDAQTAKLKANLVTLAKDFENYYLANGEFCPASGGDLCISAVSTDYLRPDAISNVPFDQMSSDKVEGHFKINDKVCIKVWAGTWKPSRKQAWSFNIMNDSDCLAELRKPQYDDVQWLFTGYTDYAMTTIKNVVKAPASGGQARHWMNDPSKGVEW